MRAPIARWGFTTRPIGRLCSRGVPTRSCRERRMAQAGAHLIDNVLPDAPLRQSLLTVPFPLRMLLAKDPALLSSVVRI
ncbi:MAG: hypothetical protein MUF54_21170 [Polyangiaceae bacterium]|nr:hypothetical protein [Polyangiaceae bacterium]